MRSAAAEGPVAQTTFDATTWRHSGAALLDPVASLDVLRHACVPSGWSLQEVQEAELIHERPGRRRTVLYRVLAGRGPEPAREAWWFGKQYASKKGARVRALLDVLQGRSFHPSETSNAYAVPDPIGYAPRVRLLVTARLLAIYESLLHP